MSPPSLPPLLALDPTRSTQNPEPRKHLTLRGLARAGSSGAPHALGGRPSPSGPGTLSAADSDSILRCVLLESRVGWKEEGRRGGWVRSCGAVAERKCCGEDCEGLCGRCGRGRLGDGRVWSRRPREESRSKRRCIPRQRARERDNKTNTMCVCMWASAGSVAVLHA
eukprot:3578502-Rhodomonas_salina.1